MDKDKSGVLNLDDIKQTYNAKLHPDVKSGKKSEDDILLEFLDTFEMHYSLNHEGSRAVKSQWTNGLNTTTTSPCLSMMTSTSNS
jgi:hypothetical protein